MSLVRGSVEVVPLMVTLVRVSAASRGLKLERRDRHFGSIIAKLITNLSSTMKNFLITGIEIKKV
jgi:hypothetical protein